MEPPPDAAAGDAGADLALRAPPPEALPAYVELLEEAGARWWARGVRQWAPGSQRAQAAHLAGLAARGVLLLASDAAGPAAGAILTRAPSAEWEGAPGEALYAHRLAVATRLEGRGVGARLLARMAELARREGATFLRLDCWDGNTRLRGFYRDAGMAEREAVPVHGTRVRRFERRLAAGPPAADPLPLAEPVPRIPPPPRRTAEPLPPYRYVPGRAPHPVRHPLGHARGVPEPAVAPPDPGHVDRSPLFRHGADLFDAACWWEAHEAWEALWAALGRRGPQAAALQGLVQVAAGCLKRFTGPQPTARRLTERGLAALGPEPAGLPDLDAEALAASVRAWVGEAAGRPPVIHLRGDPAPPAA